MAELTAFSYHPGTSALHALDARVKTACLILVGLDVMSSGLPALGGITVACAACCLLVRLPVLKFFKEIRYFGLFLLFVFASRAFSGTGDPAVIAVGAFRVSGGSLLEAIAISWRLLLVVLFGWVFVATTRFVEIKAAVEWGLRPVPFLPEKRIAVMLGLLVRFIPVIFQQIQETSDAQRARCVEYRINPVFRLVHLAVPIIRRTFERADGLVIAMESRCFSEERTPHRFLISFRDRIVLWAVVGGSIGFRFQDWFFIHFHLLLF